MGGDDGNGSAGSDHLAGAGAAQKSPPSFTTVPHFPTQAEPRTSTLSATKLG